MRRPLVVGHCVDRLRHGIIEASSCFGGVSGIEVSSHYRSCDQPRVMDRRRVVVHTRHLSYYPNASDQCQRPPLSRQSASLISVTDARIHHLSTSLVDEPIICQDAWEERSLLHHLEEASTRSSSLPFPLHRSRQLEADVSPTESRSCCVQRVAHLVLMPSRRSVVSRNWGSSLNPKPPPCSRYIIMTSGKPVASRSWRHFLNPKLPLWPVTSWGLRVGP